MAALDSIFVPADPGHPLGSTEGVVVPESLRPDAPLQEATPVVIDLRAITALVLMAAAVVIVSTCLLALWGPAAAGLFGGVLLGLSGFKMWRAP